MDGGFQTQAHICPWCYDDHNGDKCKTKDVKEVVEELRAEALMLRGALEKCLDVVSDGEYPVTHSTIQEALTATPKSAELTRVVELRQHFEDVRKRPEAFFSDELENSAIALSNALSEAGL